MFFFLVPDVIKAIVFLLSEMGEETDTRQMWMPVFTSKFDGMDLAMMQIMQQTMHRYGVVLTQ